MKRRITAALLCLALCFAAGCGGNAAPIQTNLPGSAGPGPDAGTVTAAITETVPEPLTEAVPTEPSISPEPTPISATGAATEPAVTETAATEAPATETPAAEPPSPETAAEPDPVEAILMNMTLEEKVAQMFIATPEALTGGSDPVTKADESVREALERIPVGGVLLMGCNLKNPEQVRALCEGLQTVSGERVGLPLLLGVDEEGGSVARISGKAAFGVEKIPAMSTVRDAKTARRLGRTMGAYLRDLGFNLDFAPVADVLTNPENRVVRDRSFGSDPERVTELAGALAEGLLAEGVLPCWKHFPGHGGTAEDSHKGFAVLHLDPEDPERSPELRPFLAAAEAGAPLIMTGHIAVPELDPEGLPASLSPTLLSILRGPERNYEGLLVTDALGMGAITERFGPGEAAVRAVLAGNDLLLASDELEPAFEAVLAAVRDGTIPEDRIDESLRRILKVKNDLP